MKIKPFILSLITLVTLLIVNKFLFAEITQKSKNLAAIKFEGNIKNYIHQPIVIYKCYKDSLILIEEINTNDKGQFSFNGFTGENIALYKIILLKNQFFYILNDGNSVEIKTLFQPDLFNNIASDSLKVIKSEENKRFYKFQYLQQQLNTANYFLLQMMRLYPLGDSFHAQIEKEYFRRHEAMTRFIENIETRNKSLSAKIALAYYQSIIPDWKQPDDWRDSIVALGYFDYFNPADSFYLQTNILPEKMDLYLALKTNKVDNYGQPIKNELFLSSAAQEFLNQTKTNDNNFEFCFNYFLKKFSTDHQDQAYLTLFSTYYKPHAEACESALSISEELKEKANTLKKVSVGTIAPDFIIMEEKLNLYQLPAEHTLLLFWASWCPHCVEEISKIKSAIDDYQHKGKNLLVIAISLDTDEKQWAQFVEQNQLTNWINMSDFKSWDGTIPKQYNIYATPTMFLLNKEKTIIAKPETVQQLINTLL